MKRSLMHIWSKQGVSAWVRHTGLWEEEGVEARNFLRVKAGSGFQRRHPGALAQP